MSFGVTGVSRRRISVATGEVVADFLWPRFVVIHDLVVLAVHADSSPAPENTSKSDWEQFINHTHILDEFRSRPEVQQGIRTGPDEWEITYRESHPDFISAVQVGRRAAQLWAIKLKQDFPEDRFRVYYTEFDNPIVRFHKVRPEEAVWLSDHALRTATALDLRNTLTYDTSYLDQPILGPRSIVQ